MGSSMIPVPGSGMIPMHFVPQSQHTVYIRGLPGDMSMERIRAFFEEEIGPCAFDFFRQSADKSRLFVAVRFESRQLARECFDRYRGSEILGFQCELSWYRDVRRYAAHMQRNGKEGEGPGGGGGGGNMDRERRERRNSHVAGNMPPFHHGGGVGGPEQWNMNGMMNPMMMNQMMTMMGMMPPDRRGGMMNGRGGGPMMNGGRYRGGRGGGYRGGRGSFRGSRSRSRTRSRGSQRSRSRSWSSRSRSGRSRSGSRRSGSRSPVQPVERDGSTRRSRSRSTSAPLPKSGSKLRRGSRSTSTPKRSRSPRSKSPPAAYKNHDGGSAVKSKRRRSGSRSVSPSSQHQRKHKRRRAWSLDSVANGGETKTHRDRGSGSPSCHSSCCQSRGNSPVVPAPKVNLRTDEDDDTNEPSVTAAIPEPSNESIAAILTRIQSRNTSTSADPVPEVEQRPTAPKQKVAEPVQRPVSPPMVTPSTQLAVSTVQTPMDQSDPQEEAHVTEPITVGGPIKKRLYITINNDFCKIRKDAMQDLDKTRPISAYEQNGTADKEPVVSGRGGSSTFRVPSAPNMTNGTSKACSSPPKAAKGNFALSSVSRQTATEAERQGKVNHLNATQMLALQRKQAEVESAYKADCETFSAVVKILTSKDSSIEEKLLRSLHSSLKDIGQKFLDELNDYIDNL